MSDQLRPGDFVKLIGSGMETPKFYQVDRLEPFNYATNEGDETEFSSVSTGSDSGFKNISELEPAKVPFMLYQVLMGVKDGCQYYIKIPAGVNRFGIDEDVDIGYIDNKKTPWNAMNEQYEFWLISDQYPSINASNDTGASVTPKVWFEGLKYSLIPYAGEPKIFRTIVLGGIAK